MEKNGNEEIQSWVNENITNLYEAIASTAVFCPLAEYKKLQKEIEEKKYDWQHPCITIRHQDSDEVCLIRRKESTAQKGKYIPLESGVKVYHDDNTQINTKFKKITNMTGCKNYMTCHIWDDVKVPEVFSAVANVVLLPSVIGGLSDHCNEVIQLLQYRAFELYNWYPDIREVPVKPDHYDTLEWQYPKDVDPLALHKTTVSRRSIEERLKLWSTRKNTVVYQAVAIVKAAGKDGISKAEFLTCLKGIAKNPSVTLASLMTDSGNAYGTVFGYSDDKKRILIIEKYQKLINDLWQ